MAIQLSPGVSVAEYDLNTVVPAVSSSTGAFAGNFVWGPIGQAIPISDENQLAATFGAPNNDTAISFLTAASFLAYGNDLRVVRAANTNSYNATSNTTVVQIANKAAYDYEYFHSGATNELGAFTARYAGSLGNSITVEVWDSANTTEFKLWPFAGNFSGPTTTSEYVNRAGGADDELHIAVVDSTGAITGTKGLVLEVFPYVSKAYDAVDGNGVSTYYKNVVESQSQYIYAIDPVDYANTNVTWGTTAANKTFARAYTSSGVSHTGVTSMTLSGGTDGLVGDGDLIDAYDLFENKDLIDVSLMITGNADTTVLQHIIDNIVTSAGSLQGRSGDCIAFLSPPINAVVKQHGLEALNIISWLNDDATIFDGNAGLKRTTSYAIVDSGWKYMYDIKDNLSIGIRGEWFRDQNGFRVCSPGRVSAASSDYQNSSNYAAAGSYGSTCVAASWYQVTAGLNYKPKKWLNIRPNIRYDYADGTNTDGSAYKPFGNANQTYQVLMSTDIVITF